MLKEEELPKNLLQTPPKSFPPLASTQHPQNLSPKKEKEVEEDEEEKGSPSPRRQRSSAFSGLDNDFVKNFLSKCGLPLQSPSQESPRTKESQYQVKNIDTGTITDIRELDAKFMVLHETSNPAWGGYWREIKKKRERLWDSAEDGNLEALKALLLEKDCPLPLNVNAQCLDKWTALHLACNEGHLGVVELLAEHCADLEAKTSMERRPLHLVAMRGHVEILRFLLWKGCEVDAQAQDLNTPLHYAAERGNEEVVKELLNFGAKYDVKNEDQMTAFDLSLNRNVRNLFKEIVAGKNEDPFWRTSYGNCVRPNSRADYVKRLIFESQNLSLQPKKEENEE